MVHNGLSGFLAAFWSSLALCPTELVKCRLQAARELGVTGGGVLSTIRSVLGALCAKFWNENDFFPFQIRNIVSTEGPRGLFRGLIPTWCREIPGYFCFFLGYEGSRSVNVNSNNHFSRLNVTEPSCPG